jgi:DNA-binding Lrp family transcriptional regulator
MHDMATDELDRRIINALQVDPRASWMRVAAVLGVDAVTIARRWQRLREEGIAWVTVSSSPAQLAVAMVEIECTAGALAVADELGRDPECATIYATSGGRDLLVTVAAPDQTRLAEYLLGRLGTMPTIRTVRSYPIYRTLAEGHHWHLHELSEEQLDRIGKADTVVGSRSSVLLSRNEQAIYDALVEDGRMGSADIAARTGLTPRRAREGVARLLGTRRVALRTDVSGVHCGWPISAWYFMRVPAASLDRIGPQLRRLPQTRTMLMTAGPHNLMLNVWMRELVDVARLETAIEEKLAGVEFVDRAIALRTTKRLNHILDRQDRRVGPAASPFSRQYGEVSSFRGDTTPEHRDRPGTAREPE